MYLHIALLFYLISSITLAEPSIIVSIKPIHSIVSNITQGITTPKLLITNNQSPHYFHLKPSQISLIRQADLIISVHTNIESGIAKLLSNIDIQRKLYVVENSQQNNKDGHDEHDEHDEHDKDYHDWLNISAVQKFSIRLTNKLISIDANNRLIYQSNLLAFNKKLNILKKRIKEQLLPYQNTPIMTYSNAFKQFIQTNQLNAIATFVNNHEKLSSIKNILSGREVIRSKNVQCLISIIGVAPKKINSMIENFNIKHESIDIINLNYAQNNFYYSVLMQNIANKFEKCLK